MLTPKQKYKEVERLFFRGLREGELIVDNRATTIAKELNEGYSSVSKMIDKILAKKEKELNDRINKL